MGAYLTHAPQERGSGRKVWPGVCKHRKVRIMQETLILHVQSLVKQYEDAYTELTDTESTPKKEWQASLDTEPFEDSVTDLLSTVRERAIETDDSSELLAIFEGVTDLLGELKQWLNSLYSRDTKRALPVVNAEELEALHKQIQETLKSAHALKASGMDVDPDAILRSVPTKTRKVKGGVTKTVWNCPGRIRVKTRGTRRVGSNNKTTQLIIDGVPVEGTTLGDAIRKVGATWEQFIPMLEARFPDVKNPWNKEELYMDQMVEVNGHQVGMRMVK